MKAAPVSVLLVMLLCGSSMHPVHVSVTEITFDEKEKELEIISRIFLDDLEASIRDANKDPELKLLETGETKTTDQLVGEYLQNRFKVTLNGKPQKVKYLGHEIEGEAILCFIQVSNVKKLGTIEVFNSTITELYDDQSNLVHVTIGSTIKSLRLMRDNPLGKLTFETK